MCCDMVRFLWDGVFVLAMFVKFSNNLCKVQMSSLFVCMCVFDAKTLCDCLANELLLLYLSAGGESLFCHGISAFFTQLAFTAVTAYTQYR